MKISQREYDQMKAKIEKYKLELDQLRYEVSLFRKKDKRDASELQHKRVLVEDNRALEYSNQKLRERMAKMEKVGRKVNSYV